MMNTTNRQLDDMIQKSQFAKPEANNEFWFSYHNQRRFAFEIARELFLDNNSIPTSIGLAKDFIDAFYNQAIKPGAWERNRTEGN